LKNIAVGTLLVAMVLSTNAVLIFDVAQNQMDELNKQFTNIMTETLDFLDRAWNTAKKFQDPNYDYNPSELGNYTATESSQQPSLHP
jgi:hypothetical protein